MKTSSIRKRLEALQEAVYQENKDYRKLQARILLVPEESIIGVRTPALRMLAKELKDTPEALAFMQDLPHFYHEEKQLHGFMIGYGKNFRQMIAELNAFLPYVDNWATCDSICPKLFKKHTAELLPHIEEWLQSGHTFTIRFGILCLMSFYLDDAFEARFLKKVAAVQSEEYYVKMMKAWYFATALAKQWEAAIPYIEQRRLDNWEHRKSIQKSIESYRISPEQKAYLRSLR